LIGCERVDVGRVGEWIRYFAIDWICLLRNYELAGQDKDKDCQHNAQK